MNRLRSKCAAASSELWIAFALSFAACGEPLLMPPDDAGPLVCELGSLACEDVCCAAGERCTDDGCCAEGNTCERSCCGAGEICEGAECHLDCAGATRCGSVGREVCCAASELCYLGTCVVPGAECGATGTALACDPVPVASCRRDEYCDASLGRCMPANATSECEYAPPAHEFDPVVEWEWSSDPTGRPDFVHVIATPAVADLDGDCLPEIVFHTFSMAEGSDPMSVEQALVRGVMRAIRGDGSALVFTVEPPFETDATSGIAVGDIDRDGRPDIVTCGGGLRAGRLMAFEADGTLKWVSTDPQIACEPLAATAPMLADLDRDGWVEILLRYVAVNGEDGSVQWVGRLSGTSHFAFPEDAVTAADLNDDGFLDMVGGNVAWNGRDGTLLRVAPLADDGYPAVADLDLDGDPEVVSVRPDQPRMYASRHDGGYFWGPVDLNAGRKCRARDFGGGPPTVAEIDGDGWPDVAVVGSCGLIVVRGRDGRLLWTADTDDLSVGSTGLSVFDFEGDGRAEVLYQDETRLRILSPDGDSLYEICNTSATWVEYPVVADVDADDHAEIILVSNATRSCADGTQTYGLRVIGDRRGNWVRTRRVWNQHSYHVTNVDERAEVPYAETPNWRVPGLNNFRQNVLTEGVFNAPDLTPVDLRADYQRCSSVLRLVVRVVNSGAAGAPAGVPVAFFRIDSSGARTLLGIARTTQILLPGASEEVSFDWTAEQSLLEQTARAVAVVDDDGAGAGSVNECDEANASPQITIRCQTID